MTSTNLIKSSAPKNSTPKNAFLQNMLKNLGKKNPVPKVGNQPKLKLPKLPKLNSKLKNAKGY